MAFRHEHVAGLHSVEWPPSVEARIAFWQRLPERLAKLSNRVDAAMQGKVLGEVHARIPMVTLDAQQALKLENAEADERFWSGLHEPRRRRRACDGDRPGWRSPKPPPRPPRPRVVSSASGRVRTSPVGSANRIFDHGCDTDEVGKAF
jgi:hypothetical protein